MLWRRKLVVVVAAVIAVVAAVGYDSRRVPIYQGQADLLLTPQLSQAVNAANGGSGGVGTVDPATAVKVIQSQTTENAAAQLLKLRTVPVAGAAQQGTTNVISITVQSRDPVFAARVANAYANAYIAQERTQAVNSLVDASTQFSSRISALDSQLSAVEGQINAVTAQEVPIATPSGIVGLPQPTPAQAAQIAALSLQVTTLNEQESAFKQQLGQLQVAANLAGGGGQLVTAAVPTRVPVSPHKTRDALLALAVGLALGVGLALLRDFQDDRIRSEDDLRRAVGGLPAIGLIPALEDWKNHSAAKLVSVDAPNSQPAEAYRELRTALQFMSLDKPIRFLVVVSPVAGDGKTTTVANLAVNMAQAGQRVVAVCGDLRRPRLHEFFGLNNDTGLTSVLLGEATLTEALQLVPGNDRLRVLAAGPIPPNPSELLSSRAVMDLMTSLGEIADVILIDTPPVLPVTDGAVLAARADAVVLVASANKTNRRAAARAVELLGRVGARLVGVIVNNVPRAGSGYSYGYGYGYGYGGSYRYEPAHRSTASSGEKAAKSNGKTPPKDDRPIEPQSESATAEPPVKVAAADGSPETRNGNTVIVQANNPEALGPNPSNVGTENAPAPEEAD